MVQTIAPRDSGGLPGTDTEQLHNEPLELEPEPLGPDIAFEVSPSGALPAGIPVEPNTLLFEARDEGFGDIFGEIPALAPDLKVDPMPQTQEAGGQPAGVVIDNQHAATVLTQVSSGPGDADLPKAGPARVEETHTRLAPHTRVSATVGGPSAPNGQSSGGESPHPPVLHRPVHKIEDGGLQDFGQVSRSRGPASGAADTSFSDLAEATGLRRSPGAVDHNAPATHPGVPIPQHESPNKYPVLIDGTPPTLWSRLRWPIVAMLLLGILATVGYFLGFQTWLGGGKSEPPQSASVPRAGNAPETANAPGQPEAVSKPSDTPAKPPEASSAGVSPAVIKEPEPSPAAAAPPVVAGGAQPTHSLQAASFPSDAGAKEFAEKLVRVGVPSYVVSVDIPRRGKWFRVRVGQFASAGDATKYAEQARQRAKAAGINLDLIVCDYEKP